MLPLRGNPLTTKAFGAIFKLQIPVHESYYSFAQIQHNQFIASLETLLIGISIAFQNM